MTRTIAQISISLDGYGAGPDFGHEHPLGVGGEALHTWAFGSEDPVDLAERDAILEGHGAFVMGRNMFTPHRGDDWPADWRGWWGDEPPYRAPVFVLTHHPPAEPLTVGETTFHFVDDGIEAALERAKEAAGDKTVQISGGATTIRQYLDAGLVDELRLHIAPVLLGDGVRLFDGMQHRPELDQLGSSVTAGATHLRLRPRSSCRTPQIGDGRPEAGGRSSR
jgi:dihydrofolate reductase